MTLSRRGALRYTLSATALAGLGAAAAPMKASADGVQLTEANVRDYGATGNGISDDTAAIHAARDAAGVGGRIVIPQGTYMVSGLTASVADQTWELSNSAVIKIMIGTAKALSVTATSVSVIGGVFDCSNAVKNNARNNGIEINANDVAIRNTKIQNSPFYGIVAYNHNHITISGCTITNSSREGIWVQNALTAPSNIYDISITDNLVDNSSGGQHAAGIGVRGEGINQRVNRIEISNNTVRVPYNQPTATGAIQVTSGADWLVKNNIVMGGYLGITCPNPTRATISSNVVRGFSRIGIEIPGAVDDVTIVRNLVDPDGTSATSGIQASAGAVNDVRIVGNTIKNFSASCYLIDFNSGSSSQQVTITGNVLTSRAGSGSFTGVYFNGSITGLAMSENIVDGPSLPSSWGVQFLNSVRGANVTGNHFVNLAGAVIRMAARGASYKLDYIKAVGNSVVNCGTLLKDSTADGAVVGTNIFT